MTHGLTFWTYVQIGGPLLHLRGLCVDMHGFQMARHRLHLDQMIDYALQLDHATAKRLGWVLEHTGFERSELTVQ